MGIPGGVATISDFMAILESIDSKFERFSNVADEIFAKLLSSFLGCEVLVVVFFCKFSINVILRIRTIKPTW